MTTQFDFTNDQWDLVAIAPVVVGLAVAKAEDSGFFGSLRETRTLLGETTTVEHDGPAASLIAQASATDIGDRYASLREAPKEQLADDAVATSTRLAEVLAEIATEEEAAGYKAWVLDVARSVASAAKERGVRVSPGEAALVDRIASALGLAADR